MKKILLGLLIVAALSACTSSEKKIDIPTQIQTLSENLAINSNILNDIKSENEEVRNRLVESQEMVTIILENKKIMSLFEEKGVVLTKVVNGLSIVLTKDAAFKSSKSELTKSIEEVLDSVGETLVMYPETKVVIRGHADTSGTEKINQKLSEDRAIAAATYLVKEGIDSTRIETLGVGSSEPFEDNITEIGKAGNRTIDLTIMY